MRSSVATRNYQRLRHHPASAWRRLVFVIFGAALMAFNINTFVHAGGILPGGFTGVALLTRDIAAKYADISIPFSPIYYLLNAAPAVVAFCFIGRRFTLYSALMILLTGVFTDAMPPMFTRDLQLHDALLSAVFGGLVNALAIGACLSVGATSGGTDFIAIYVAEKFHRNAWNYIFVGNCAVLAVAGYLFAWEQALYSIIFQYISTRALNGLCKEYQQCTLLIVTAKPEEIYALIRDELHHGATALTGVGLHAKSEKTLLYSVVDTDEAPALMAAIREIDPAAFVNVWRTDHVYGNFYHRPKD
ncbi:MAG: YitT family protein [Planctomycetota bacterium]|jgi:uncharacterized membrane-anchored protein YitT (DUF2179 family)|nr:YitT family protein [Planctomycetota bacterium]